MTDTIQMHPKSVMIAAGDLRRSATCWTWRVILSGGSEQGVRVFRLRVRGRRPRLPGDSRLRVAIGIEGVDVFGFPPGHEVRRVGHDSAYDEAEGEE